MSEVTAYFRSKIKCHISLVTVREYLEYKGWKKDDKRVRFGYYYYLGDDIENSTEAVFVPDCDNFADFNRVMNDLCNDLAKIEKCSVPEILNRIGADCHDAEPEVVHYREVRGTIL